LQVLFFDCFYFAAAVYNSCVVASAKVSSNFLEAVPGQISGQIHTNLTWCNNALVTFFALQISKSDVEMPGYDIDNISDAYIFD